MVRVSDFGFCCVDVATIGILFSVVRSCLICVVVCAYAVLCLRVGFDGCGGFLLAGALNPNFLEGSFNLDFGAVRALK